MEFNMFCKSDSGNELGTTKASMNRTRKTNASAGPKKKFSTLSLMKKSYGIRHSKIIK
jgi:hypothetical protein